MATHTYNIPSLVIDFSEDANASSAVAADPHFQNADYIVIEGPDALDQTVTVQVSFDAGSSFSDYEAPEDGADVVVPAGTAVVVRCTGFDQIRVNSASTGETADRTFVCRAVETLNSPRRFL